jgi:tetratricopeptide (TPR) repeat protein
MHTFFGWFSALAMTALAWPVVGVALAVAPEVRQANAVVPALSSPRPPGLLEPYSGYDLVFGPGSERVLGPDVAPVVEKMLAGPFADCAIGPDIALQARRIAFQLICQEGAIDLALVGKDANTVYAKNTPAEWLLMGFVLQVPAPAARCSQACLALRRGRIAAVAAAVRAVEAQITWQRVLPEPGSTAGKWLQALIDAQRALASGDRKQAKQLVEGVQAKQPVRELSAKQALDLALLAHESASFGVLTKAKQQLNARLAEPAAAESADTAPLQWAALALAGEPTAAADQALAALAKSPGVDMIPVVRALAALRHFRQAARVLDSGPLSDPAPRLELLKLRLGLASALHDTQAEVPLGKRMLQLDPQSAVGYDILATGLARQRKYREAIELLYELSQRHPEHVSILGRLAGLLNALVIQAERDPTKQQDLVALTARMQQASTKSTDLVARFIVAMSVYYAGKWEQALPLFEALLDSGDRHPRIPLYCAMTHFWLGHQERAETLIATAVTFGPVDPDVYYYRSQIVRHRNLPVAIADLERYEQMTSEPWATGPATSSHRVGAELAFLRKGLLPPAWDKPGPDRPVFEPHSQQGTIASESARLGNVVVAGVTAPVDLPPIASPTDLGIAYTLTTIAGPVTATDVATAATPVGVSVRPPGVMPAMTPPAEEPPPEQPPWLPIALALAVSAAVGVWFWRRKPPGAP